MKKALLFALVLVFSLTVLSAALAITEGDYAWEGYTLTLTSFTTQPMFAPAGMTDGQYPVAVELTVPDAIWADDALYDALYAQARLVDESGAMYAPGAATAKDQQLTLLFAVDNASPVDTLALEFGAEATSGVPEAYVGEWAGSADTIALSFRVDADGTGAYTFEQSGYVESYDFSLMVESETFSVAVPEDNQLGIVACEGTYAYADGVLTLHVRTSFAGGGVFEYEVPCRRVEPAAGDGASASGAKESVFPVKFSVYGKTYSLAGYTIGVAESGNTAVKIRGEGIAFLKDASGNSATPVTAIFLIDGEAREVPVSSMILHASAPIASLTTDPIDHEMVFELPTSNIPEGITLINTESGETVLAFSVDEEPQLMDETAVE